MAQAALKKKTDTNKEINVVTTDASEAAGEDRQPVREITVFRDVVNIHFAPSPESPVKGQGLIGEHYRLLGWARNGWLKIEMGDGTPGWIPTKYVRPVETEDKVSSSPKKENKKGKFVYPVEEWGTDLQSEHERYLVEKHFKKPVILTDYPKEIKSFYMRQNEDGKTVAAMDILFPGIGEIVGGSQREERMDVLLKRMEEMNIPTEEMWWFLDTRRFGSTPHAGFGLGFERMVQFVTGMGNIRDVIAFPRTPGNAEF